MNKRNAKISIAIVLLLVVSFFWGELDPFSNKGVPEVDENIVIQKTDEKEEAEGEEFNLALALEKDTILEAESTEDEVESEEERDLKEVDMDIELEEKEEKAKADASKDKKPAGKVAEKAKEDKDDLVVAKNDQMPKVKMAQVSQDSLTLKINAKTILNNMDKLDKNKAKLIPKNGMIFDSSNVAVNEGDSVFDVLIREMQSAGIHLESNVTPVYKTNYVEGINNIYEFDAGELSGWMYKVNGKFPSKGASEVKVKPGDVIEWVYTCNLGEDIGGKNSTGGRR